MSHKLTILFITSLLLGGCMRVPEIPPLLAHDKAQTVMPAISSLPG
ncbi:MULTISPECIES: hypothetical protein [unclassified Pseudomonas]|nr:MULTISPECIES: hypothetical protein [unclassified Pseudomonas]TWC21405.1 hypothetical protein FBX99_107145 [Pseudomonas sp. SJZ074]TWC11627.1 hypothetical protein FBY00_13037 [Pseudomonas sp. SJZ075]TWC28232.1 hypothetical protein FBY02_13233 [Pseudomonas sp. SJZ078]TWC39096.1 hypothetical protein FBY06_10734 [Pseudomonas sp. SJZ085]TWC48261.1 hypothetical protein FBY11_13034 [Pseudomonas sp. SJZ124]